MVKKLNNDYSLLRKHRRFFYATVLCLFIALILSACSNRQTPEGIFDNYLYRLHNSLEIDEKKLTLEPVLAEAISILPRYPKRSSLLHSINTSSINLLEFLRLSQCDLQRHIGERNSSLGKLQKDSQRLIYDIEFIRLAKACIEILEADKPLRNVLQSAVKDKQTQLPLLLWNATFASEEWVYLFSLSTNFISAEQPPQKPNNLYEAFETLERQIGGDKNLTRIDLSDFEAVLAIITSRKYLGELRRSMALIQTGLSQADALIKQRIDQRPLCRKSVPNAQFAIVNNVFRKFYIGEVQPYLASVYQQAEISLQHIDQLLALQTIPDTYHSFWLSVYKSDNSEWQKFKYSIQNHTENWQALLKQCGRLPG